MGTSFSPERPRRSTLISVGLVAGCTLAYQVVLTRLFSAVLAYHFSFFAISLALLGAGGGALLVFLRSEQFAREDPGAALARWSAIFALLLIACPILLVSFDYEGTGAAFALNLGLASTVAALPPLASGVVIALAISRYTPWIGRVYAFDLGGAGIGALLVVPSLVYPAPALLVALGGLTAVACTLFAGTRTRTRRLGFCLIGLSALVLAFGSNASWLYLPMSRLVDTDRVFERWTPLARVFGFDGHGRAGLEDFTAITYDRVYAPVPIVGDGAPPDWRMLTTGPQSIGYALTGPGHALVIGGGGGETPDDASSNSAADGPVSH